MELSTSTVTYRDRSRVLVAIGVLLLLVGIPIAFLGPLEMYSFYFFVEGGRFHYPGFGFGSFMFGNIAAQIVGYYLVGATLIVLGYGHLKVHRWARRLAIALLWFWLVAGLPLIVAFLFVLAGTKELSPAAGLIAVVLLLLSYLLLPWLLIRFYQSRNVALTFETRGPRSCWIEGVPMPNLVLSTLYLFYIVVLHVLILFNGIFPLFGAFAFGFKGIVLLDISILWLVFLTWGTLKQYLWAWWGGLIYLSLLTFSTIRTLVQSSYADMLAGLEFPAREIEFLDGLPLEGYHFAVLAGIPLLISWGLIIFSRRCFDPKKRDTL